MAKKAQEPKQVTVDQETIKQAISEGRSLIEQGKTKVEAALAIYQILKDQPQRTIIAAFIEGATLTEKGALTYWYNCRRKLGKDRRDSSK